MTRVAFIPDILMRTPMYCGKCIYNVIVYLEASDIRQEAGEFMSKQEVLHSIQGLELREDIIVL